MVASQDLPVSTPDAASTATVRVRWAAIALPSVCLLWAGMQMGMVLATVTVIRAAVHQMGPTLSRPVGMDVNRLVFSAFSSAQLAWCAITVLLLFVCRPYTRFPRLVGTLLLLCCLLAVFQHFVLLPVLAERALTIARGGTPPPSPTHALYSSSSMLQLAALITSGILSIRALVGGKQ